MTPVKASLLILAFAAASAAQSSPERVRKLQESFLAPCCWSENVAMHRSEAAVQMRQEIATMVAQGKNDREIRDHFKSLYGARVLVEPEGGTGQFLYVVPALASLAGAIWIVFLIRKWLKTPPPEEAPHSPASH